MLTLLLLIPLIGALAVAVIPKGQASLAKWVAAAFSGADLLVAIYLLLNFDFSEAGLQFVQRVPWIEQVGIEYFLAVDGLSMPLVALTALLFFLAVIASWKIEDRPKFYFSMLLLLQVGMVGVFSSLDFVLFYVFWEIVLVPMYFIIAQWGGIRREYAAIKFFLYTFFGSVFMLVGIVALFLQTGTFNMIEMAGMDLGPATMYGFQWWVFAAFFIGFAVKVPIFPFHTWLPDAHVEAPTAASVLLAGVMLKMGTYGFLRISLPILPEIFKMWQVPIAILAVISILYGAIVAFAQTDVKKLVAYSSVSHMGFAMLGIASGTAIGLNAAMVVNISHGLLTGMLFFLVGMVYDRTHTREISKLSGIAYKMPVFTGLFGLAAFGSMGVPLISGFVGEFLSLVGAWTSETMPKILVVLAAVGILLGAAYMLWLLQRMIFGAPSEAVEKCSDINVREISTVLPLGILAVVIGVVWFVLLNFTDPFATTLSKLVGS